MVMAMSLKKIILLIHACRAHSYRAITKWIESKDRTAVAQRVGVKSMITHLAVKMTATPSISRATVSICAYMVMFERPLIDVNEHFSSTSQTRQFKDEDRCKAIAARMYEIKDSARSSIVPTFTKEEMEAHIDEIMKMNGIKSQERFLGETTARPVLDFLWRVLPFVHVYLKSVSRDGKTGILAVQIIHDAELDSTGQAKPIFGGEFEQSVRLPFEGGCLNNPLYEPHPDVDKKGGRNKRPLIVEYLGGWLSTVPIWARAACELIQMCTKTKGKSHE